MSAANYPEPVSDGAESPAIERSWAMLRMAFSWHQPKPAGRVERTAHHAALFFLALLPAWLIVGDHVSIAAAVATTALGVVAYSLAWAAWVCYGRPRRS